MEKFVSVSYSIDSHKLVLVITSQAKTRAYNWQSSYKEYRVIVNTIEQQTANVKLGLHDNVLSFAASL